MLSLVLDANKMLIVNKVNNNTNINKLIKKSIKPKAIKLSKSRKLKSKKLSKS